MFRSFPRNLVGCLALTAALGVASACTSDPEATIEPVPGEVTGGEIIVSGDLDDGATLVTAPNSTAVAAADPGDDAPSSTTSDSLPRNSTTTAPATTSAPTSAPADSPSSNAAPSDDDELVGDGPVMTVSVADVDDTDSGGLSPVFFALAASSDDCTGNSGSATLRWEVVGTESVDIAIDSRDQIIQAGQPAAGETDVPLDCEDGNKYFVIASNAEGTTVRTVTVGPG